MIIIEPKFINKLILEACISLGFKGEEIDIKFESPNGESFHYELYNKTFLICKVQRSLVSDTPANVWVTKMSIDSRNLLKIAKHLEEVLGEKVAVHIT